MGEFIIIHKEHSIHFIRIFNIYLSYQGLLHVLCLQILKLLLDDLHQIFLEVVSQVSHCLVLEALKGIHFGLLVVLHQVSLLNGQLGYVVLEGEVVLLQGLYLGLLALALADVGPGVFNVGDYSLVDSLYVVPDKLFIPLLLLR